MQLPEPSADALAHSAELLTRIRSEVRMEGWVSFARYMERALYEPGLGYYSGGSRKFGEKGDFIEVGEYNARLWVNLTDYLDTGLFLDHRIARRMLGQMSKGKDFLNLFSYTGSASVHAGLGGARSTTTVDMSRTYLEWAERNLRLNGLTGRQHRLLQADVLGWLRDTDEQFDLIFIDPPTFSNSKRMEDSFDVQRDHLRLMTDLKRLLRKGGTIMFSNNKRGFRMDHDGLAALGLKAQEISQKTLSQDFARNRQIHNCWLISAV